MSKTGLRTIREFADRKGKSPFASWFASLHAEAAAKVTRALVMLAQGNWSNTKGVGGGVLEYRVNFGPGYRVYFANDGERLVILLGGGSKKAQQRDISNAISNWHDYKTRKKQEGTHGSDKGI